MSIYLASTKSISRAKGQSAVASASYRAGVELQDNRYGKTHDYSKRDGVVSADIILPTLLEKKNIVIDRGEVWNLAEKSESRKNSRVAREWLVNLPHELNELERKELAHSFAKKLADKFGVIADCAIHEPSKYEVEKRGADPRNFHAHIMLTTRKAELDANGKVTLTDKADCELSDSDRLKKGLSKAKDEVKEIRKIWEDLANEKLAEKGLDLIDSRSYEERGLDIIPQVKVGPVATKKERDHYQRELEKTAKNPSYIIDSNPVTPPGIINAMIFERNELVFESRKRKEQTNEIIVKRIDRAKREINTAEQAIEIFTQFDSFTSKRINTAERQIERAEQRIDSSKQQAISTDKAINAAERAVTRADTAVNETLKTKAIDAAIDYCKAHIALKYQNHTGSLGEKSKVIADTFDSRQKSIIDNFAKHNNLQLTDPSQANNFNFKTKEFFKNNIHKSDVRELAEILADPETERLQYSKSLSDEREQSLAEKTDIHTLDMSKTSQQANLDVSDDYEPPSPF